MLWPPQIEDVKAEQGIPRTDTRDDAALQVSLDAAVAYVEDQRGGDFNFAHATTGDIALKPAPPPNILLGTLRLAIRLRSRAKSPEALVDLGDFGSARIPGTDPDIDRLLGLGRFRAPMVL